MKKKIMMLLLAVSLLTICVVPAFAVAASNNIPSKDYTYTPADVQALGDTLANGQKTSGVASADNDAFDDYVTVETIVTPIDKNTFQVSEPDGTVIGTYSVFPDAAPISRASWRLNWTAGPGQQVGGNDSISSYKGLTFTYNIAGVPGGASQLGILAHDTKRFYPMRTSSTGKFIGSFSLDKSYGNISLGIQNNSLNTVVYAGIYSI